MVDLHDVLSETIKKGFYRNKQDSGDRFYKFVYFGSHMCPARVYDSNGNWIERVQVPTNKRRDYVLVSDGQIPEALRAQESQLAEKTQQSKQESLQDKAERALHHGITPAQAQLDIDILNASQDSPG